MTDLQNGPAGLVFGTHQGLPWHLDPVLADPCPDDTPSLDGRPYGPTRQHAAALTGGDKFDNRLWHLDGGRPARITISRAEQSGKLAVRFGGECVGDEIFSFDVISFDKLPIAQMMIRGKMNSNSSRKSGI